jgi:5,10-methylenetetrahydrofolate reductase
MSRPAVPSLVLEITPPARPRPDVLLRRASALAPAVRVVNVISRPERWSSLEAAGVLRAKGLDPVWHLANRGRRLADIERAIERAAEAGVRRVLCVRGEYKAEESPDEPKIREVVALLRGRLPDASIGVTFNHHLDASRALDNLFRKLDAGADFVQTQVTFDLRGLRPLAARLAERAPGVALLPMVFPVESAESLRRVARRLGIPLDQALFDRLEREGADAGWRAFGDTLDAIAHEPGFAGAALMTPIDLAPAYRATLRTIVARHAAT